MKCDMRANNSNLFLFYVAFALFGYCLIAPIAEIVSPNSEFSPITILYRMAVLGGALVFIYQMFFINRKTYIDTRGKHAFLLLLFFWFIYTCRLIFDAMFQEHLLDDNTISSYVTLGYFIVFIPLISLARSYNEIDLEYLFHISFYILLFGVVFTLSISAFQILNGSWEGGQRLSSERLNPISLGRYSAVLFILGFGLMKIQHKKRLFLVTGMLIGLIGVLLSGSRGAFVSLILVLIVTILSKASFKKILWFSLLLPLSAAMGIFLMSILVPEIDVIDNYLAMGGKDDQSAQIRYQMYNGALEQFYNNPIFGDLIIEREYKFYPHNQVLEILMATGIIGLLVFTTLNVFVFRKLKCLKNRNTNDESASIFLKYCVLFYIFAGMFTGTILGALEYWYLVVIICFSSMKFSLLVNTPSKISEI